MPQIQERALYTREQTEFRECFTHGMDLLTEVIDRDGPEAIVQAVENYVERWRRQKPSFLGQLLGKKPNVVQTALALGTIWGNQLVKRFGWQWTCLQRKGIDCYCVASPDRALIVYPTYFIKECLDYPTADCTVMLAFNMLAAGSIPKFPERGYENLMAGVRRIVPKS